MNHEHFFQWWWSYPSLFSYSFFEEKVLPFVVSFVNPLVFTRWRSTPGSYSARSMKNNNNNNNNNNNILKQQHWTMNIFSVMVVLPLTLIHIHFLRRRSYSSSFHLSIPWFSPGGIKGPPGLHRGGGQGVPKNHRTMLGESFSETAAG